ITAKPTMKMTYSPPLSWTWNEPGKAVGGQSLTEASAQNRINSDIEFAVIKAVESYGYSTSGVSVRNAVAPLDIPLQAGADCTVVGNGVREDTAVTKKCALGSGPTSAAPLLSTSSTLSVTSPIALAQSNWDNIATKVWMALTNDAGVKFYGLIEVQA
ncbi:hypothetical protein PMAYCL1PPCAC_11681, partial [Pristionchus mayeri]